LPHLSQKTSGNNKSNPSVDTHFGQGENRPLVLFNPAQSWHTTLLHARQTMGASEVSFVPIWTWYLSFAIVRQSFPHTTQTGKAPGVITTPHFEDTDKEIPIFSLMASIMEACEYFSIFDGMQISFRL
jgi:hypothetical protein